MDTPILILSPDFAVVCAASPVAEPVLPEVPVVDCPHPISIVAVIAMHMNKLKIRLFIAILL